jgi:DNA replication protein DnaC
MENSNPINAQIGIFAKQLRLPTIGNYEKVIRKMDPNTGYESFLLEILKQEVTHRQENQQKRRLRIAGFPKPKTLDEFDYSRLDHVRQEYIWELASCDYIKRRENIIMIGNTGMGKSHMSIGLGMRACKEGFHVKFITAANLVNMLSEARDSYRLNKLEKSFQNFDLLIIDELSYLTFNRHHSELFSR